MLTKKLINIFIIIILIFSVFITSISTAQSLPPFNITTKRVGINSYLVTFNNPDNATINITYVINPYSSNSTITTFTIYTTVTKLYNITAEVVFLAYYNGIQIYYLQIPYTSSVPTIVVKSNNTENLVTITVPEANEYEVTITVGNIVIFSAVLTAMTTTITYQAYDYPSYINITDLPSNFTIISKVIQPVKGNYNVNVTLLQNFTYIVKYNISLQSEILIYSINGSVIYNTIVNGSGTIYLPAKLNASVLAIIHNYAVVYTKTFPPLPIEIIHIANGTNIITVIVINNTKVSVYNYTYNSTILKNSTFYKNSILNNTIYKNNTINNTLTKNYTLNNTSIPVFYILFTLSTALLIIFIFISLILNTKTKRLERENRELRREKK